MLCSMFTNQYTDVAQQGNKEKGNLLLGLTPPGVSNQQSAVVLHKNILDFPLALLINICRHTSQ